MTQNEIQTRLKEAYAYRDILLKRRGKLNDLESEVHDEIRRLLNDAECRADLRPSQAPPTGASGRICTNWYECPECDEPRDPGGKCPDCGTELVIKSSSW
ncbi:MAG: hypothetical protein IIA44_13055 [Acidobacteria bacterium]|nr:hypothetical protein [Acidobacteriota bacterium]